MKHATLLILLALSFGCASASAADLPTVTVEHLYFLRTRGTGLRKLNADAMIEYCTAQKLGGRSFEDLYVQLSTMRIELAKLREVEGLPNDDTRVKLIRKTYDAYYSLLREEAQRVQNGLVREGQIASDTLDAIGRDQAAAAR